MKLLTRQSAHFKFFYLPNSLAEAEISSIILSEEEAFLKVAEFFGKKDFPLIKYYLYPDNDAKEKSTGNEGNGHADLKEFSVHAVYSEDIKCIGPHEITHLLASYFGLPLQILREGIAEYLSEKWDRKPHRYWVKEFNKDGALYEISDLFKDSFWYESNELVAYPEAGDFIGFLISKIGKQKIFELYRKLKNSNNSEVNGKIFEQITGKTLEVFAMEWIQEVEADQLN